MLSEQQKSNNIKFTEKKISQEKAFKLNVFLNKNYKSLSIAGGIVILIIGVYFLWLPTWQSITDKNSTILPALKLDRDNKASYLIKLRDLDKKISEIESGKKSDTIDKVDKILPSEPGLENLFVELEDITANAGFSLDSIAVNRVAYSLNSLPEFVLANKLSIPLFDDKIRAIDIAINVKGGGYIQFKNLLKRIEENTRLFNVITLNFSSLSKDDYIGQSGEDISDKEYSINLRTYYLDKDYVPTNDGESAPTNIPEQQ